MSIDTVKQRIREIVCEYGQLQPEEVADLVLFLASDESTAITAQAIQIDGGLLASTDLTGVPPLR